MRTFLQRAGRYAPYATYGLTAGAVAGAPGSEYYSPVLDAVGNAFDLPGSSVRDLLVGRNPLDQFASPFSADNRVTGRDVLDHWGVTAPNKETGMAGWLDDPMEGLRDLAGFGVEILTDPLNVVSALKLGKLFRAGKKATTHNAALEALQRNPERQRLGREMVEAYGESGEHTMTLLDAATIAQKKDPNLVYGGVTAKRLEGAVAGIAATSAVADQLMESPLQQPAIPRPRLMQDEANDLFAGRIDQDQYNRLAAAGVGPEDADPRRLYQSPLNPQNTLMDDKNWVFVHGGSNWRDFDKSFLGSGEPGGLRPLGNGLYGYAARNDEELLRAISGAKVYANEYGGGDPQIHLFSVQPPVGHTSWAGQHAPDYLFTDTQKRIGDLYEHANSLPVGSERSAAFAEARRLSDANKVNYRLRVEMLPAQGDGFPGLIEAAVHDPSLLNRIGMAPANTPNEKIARLLAGLNPEEPDPNFYTQSPLDDQAPRGAIQFSPDGTTLMAFDPDPSTAPHEMSHYMRRRFMPGNPWTRDREEAFAGGFENFAATTSTSSPAMSAAFQYFNQEIPKVYDPQMGYRNLPARGGYDYADLLGVTETTSPLDPKQAPDLITPAGMALVRNLLSRFSQHGGI